MPTNKPLSPIIEVSNEQDRDSLNLYRMYRVFIQIRVIIQTTVKWNYNNCFFFL